MSNRATQTDLHKRESEIISYIQDNVKVSVFCDILSVEYKCSPSAIRKQYEKIIRDIRAGSKADREVLRSILSIQLDLAYKIAKDTKNTKNMIETVKEKARLHGLYDKEDASRETVPKFIEYGEKDFSIKPVLVGDKVDSK
ncbi:hypothetical protein KAR91_24730 [Candidatus Pacearchaeota archaeon]|nr:hypothetical protein [Candidatus Pacearchaeota archaeon]